ncbi:MAG TPA: amidase [Acidimicrobiia bacterium]|nr:amidase [Acidimicrobiia bacterium]
MTDLARLDATASAQLVRDGEVSATELVDAAIERIERLNGELNAVIHERFEKARKEASLVAAGDDLLFAGVPFVHKDLDGFTAGDPYHAGSRFLKEAGFVADHDSYLAASLKAAGFILVGKTNTPELGLQPTTEPEAYGPSRNPWNTGHSTGGSSGGSAAAVASGMVPVGHAGDGGGSIRIPASECGLVGLKPSRGRVSLGPDDDESWDGLVQRGVVTRSVRDTAAVLDVLSGATLGDPYAAPTPERPFADEVDADPGRLRIGVLATDPTGSTEVHVDCVTATEDAGRLLEGLGHTVEAAYPQALEDPGVTEHFFPLFGAWAAYDLRMWEQMVGRAPTEDDVEAGTWAVAQMGAATSAVDYYRAARWMNGWTRRVAEWWNDFDVLVTPTISEPPPPLGEFTDTPDFPGRGLVKSSAIVPFTVPFNITGQPAVSLPLSWNEAGLPVGVQFVAAYGREDVLIRLASQLEEARPWADRRPAIFA